MPAPIRQYEERVSPNPISNMAHADPSQWAVGEGGLGGAGFALAGRAAADFASAEARVEEANGKAWAAKAASQARLEWTTHFTQRQEAAEPGAPEFTPKLLKDFDEYSTKLVENAPSGYAQRSLAAKMDAFRTSLGDAAVGFEAKARIDWRMDQYNVSIDNTKKLMNTDPGQYKSALADRVEEIDASALPPIQKSAMREKAIEGISEAAAWTQIQRSPSAFLQSIGFGAVPAGKTRKSSGDLMGITGNEAFDALNFDKRKQMFEGAVRLKAQLDSDAERAAIQQGKLVADNAMKEGWGRLASGKLTRSYIEELRPVLSAPEYHSLLIGLKTAGEGGQKTDPATFRQLEALVYSDPQEAKKFAFTAHKSGLLSNDNFASALGRIQTLDRQGGPKTEYEMSRKYIVGSLDPGPMVQDPVARSRMAEGLDTFDRWVNAEKRTDKEIQERAREVVDQYKFIDLSQTVLALPSPRSGTIRRAPQDVAGMSQDILNAANKAEADHNSGRLSDADYQSEMGILNRWRKTLAGKK